MANPHPTPTKLKILKGNPGKRALNRNEPNPTQSIPEAPTHLNELAKTEWDRITVELDRVGLLTEMDRGTLAAYCVAYGRWVECETKLNATGPILKSKDGGFYQNPFLSAANKAMEQLIRFSVLFGFDPSSRTRLCVPAGDDKGSAFDKLMDRLRGASSEN